MVEVRICDKALKLARELRRFEEYDVAGVSDLLKIMLVNACIFPKVSFNWYVNFHFTQGSRSGHYLKVV